MVASFLNLCDDQLRARQLRQGGLGLVGGLRN
jgi:hypothetical protein